MEAILSLFIMRVYGYIYKSYEPPEGSFGISRLNLF
jgi:hypothetical protein